MLGCHAADSRFVETGYMKSILQHALHGVRADRDLQDALFCTACWVSFALVVIASVALPA